MKSDAEWKCELTCDQYNVLRRHGTERAGTSPLDKNYEPGLYVCAGCGSALFASETKFNSGTGWPSFYAAIENAVGTKRDRKLIFARTEVHCRNCGGHLGHVFDDGPPHHRQTLLHERRRVAVHSAARKGGRLRPAALTHMTAATLQPCAGPAPGRQAGP